MRTLVDKVDAYIWKHGYPHAPVSRAALRAEFGSDRSVRRAIAALREEGVNVIAHPQGGYYISKDPAATKRQHRQHVKRIRALARAARRMERTLAELPPVGQRVLDLIDKGGE